MSYRIHAVVAAAIAACAGSAHAGAPAYSGVLGTPGFGGSYVSSFASYDDGAGDALYAIGSFSAIGVAGGSGIARWTGSSWASVGGGLQGGFSSTMAAFQGDLIAGGYFDSAGGVADSAKLARWDGTAWSSMDAQSSSFLNSVWDLQVWDDGSSGEQLYVAGNYLDLNGQPALDHIAKWDGSAYTPVGGTIGGAVPLIVLDLHPADLGAGEGLYAGGRFLTIGGVNANNIARWDGTAWSPLGAGITRTSGIAQVLHMTSWDDGSGEALYVGGGFNRAGGNAVTNVAKWDGSSWSSMGDGLNGVVQELVVWDDGSGEALYALGNFAASGTVPMVGIAKWNGTSWEAVGDGLNDNAFGAIVYDFGSGPELVIGGSFSMAGGLSANRAASLVPAASCPPDLAEPFGSLNFFDISAFIGLFNAGDLGADFAAPFGTLNFFDVAEYIAQFNAGCP